jgi:molecular chaperone Hsp33
MCHCSRERLSSILGMLPTAELKDMRDNGPFPLEMRCHYCNSVYHFSKKEIQAIYSRRENTAS